VSQSALFRETTNYLYVLEKIQKYRHESNLTVIAYCLMPTHYHFALRQEGDQPAGNLPQLVFNSYSKAYNLKYGHSGTLFEGRFCAKVIDTPGYLLHLCRYIHGNPVKDGLVADPADWPWSNYLEWIGERNGSLVDRDFIKTQFGDAANYQKSLALYLKSLDLPADVKKFLDDLEK